MKSLDEQISALKKTLRKRTQYFIHAQSEIAEINISTMFYSTGIGLVLLTFLILVTPLIIEGWLPTWEYYALYPVLAVFFIFSFFIRRIKRPRINLIKFSCILMYACIFGGLILISVFPYPEQAEVYISLFIMVMPALLIMRPGVTLTISVLFGGLFIALAILFKPEAYASHDVFSTLAAIMFSRVVSVFVSCLRANDYWTRKELFNLSNIDSLTSLSNKKAGERECTDYLSTVGEKQCYAAMMLDLDDFKMVNDSFGHRRGDNVLKLFGHSLRDLFGTDDVVSRIGGDEFFVLMKDIDDIKSAEQRAKDIIAINDGIKEQTGTSCSIGVVFVKGKRLLFEDIYDSADKALYMSKKAGKNRYEIVEYI